MFPSAHPPRGGLIPTLVGRRCSALAVSSVALTARRPSEQFVDERLRGWATIEEFRDVRFRSAHRFQRGHPHHGLLAYVEDHRVPGRGGHSIRIPAQALAA